MDNLTKAWVIAVLYKSDKFTQETISILLGINNVKIVRAITQQQGYVRRVLVNFRPIIRREEVEFLTGVGDDIRFFYCEQMIQKNKIREITMQSMTSFLNNSQY